MCVIVFKYMYITDVCKLSAGWYLNYEYTESDCCCFVKCIFVCNNTNDILAYYSLVYSAVSNEKYCESNYRVYYDNKCTTLKWQIMVGDRNWRKCVVVLVLSMVMQRRWGGFLRLDWYSAFILIWDYVRGMIILLVIRL